MSAPTSNPQPPKGKTAGFVAGVLGLAGIFGFAIVIVAILLAMSWGIYSIASPPKYGNENPGIQQVKALQKQLNDNYGISLSLNQTKQLSCTYLIHRSSNVGACFWEKFNSDRMFGTTWYKQKTGKIEYITLSQKGGKPVLFESPIDTKRYKVAMSTLESKLRESYGIKLTQSQLTALDCKADTLRGYHVFCYSQASPREASSDFDKVFGGGQAKSPLEKDYGTIKYTKDNGDTVEITLAIKNGKAYLVEQKLGSDITF